MLRGVWGSGKHHRAGVRPRLWEPTLHLPRSRQRGGGDHRWLSWRECCETGLRARGFQTCQLLLEQAGLGITKLHRGEVLATGADGNVEDDLPGPKKTKGSSGVYQTLGLFTRGGVQGITTATQTSSHLTRYLNCFVDIIFQKYVDIFHCLLRCPE